MRSAVRATRVFCVVRPAIALLGIGSHRRYSSPAVAASRLHFVCSRHYLRRGLSLGERALMAWQHAAFEDATFDEAYFEGVDADEGLLLWTHQADKTRFRLVLRLGDRAITEGDLRLTLMVGSQALHNICFSWVHSKAETHHVAVVPFIARNQARWRKDTDALDAFEKAFPNNSASYFTYAALQGVARAVGAPHVLAVRAVEQVVYDASEPKHFASAYDAFWQKLGAEDQGALGVTIPIPFHVTPIDEVASKHRARARQRRMFWQTIEASALAAMRIYVQSPSHTQSSGSVALSCETELVLDGS